MTPAQEYALKQYAARNGRTWKSKLWNDWCSAYYPSAPEYTSELQQLRNDPDFDLKAYRLPKD